MINHELSPTSICHGILLCFFALLSYRYGKSKSSTIEAICVAVGIVFWYPRANFIPYLFAKFVTNSILFWWQYFTEGKIPNLNKLLGHDTCWILSGNHEANADLKRETFVPEMISMRKCSQVEGVELLAGFQCHNWATRCIFQMTHSHLYSSDFLFLLGRETISTLGISLFFIIIGHFHNIQPDLASFWIATWIWGTWRNNRNLVNVVLPEEEVQIELEKLYAATKEEKIEISKLFAYLGVGYSLSNFFMWINFSVMLIFISLLVCVLISDIFMWMKFRPLFKNQFEKESIQ